MPEFTSTDKLVGNTTSNITQNWTGEELSSFFNTGEVAYVFEQVVPSATWSIAHNLGTFPSVTAVDGYNRVFNGQIEYIDNNNITLTFSSSISGKAYLN